MAVTCPNKHVHDAADVQMKICTFSMYDIRLKREPVGFWPY